MPGDLVRVQAGDKPIPSTRSLLVESESSA